MNLKPVRRILPKHKIPWIVENGFWNWKEPYITSINYIVDFWKDGDRVISGIYQISPLKEEQ